MAGLFLPHIHLSLLIRIHLPTKLERPRTYLLRQHAIRGFDGIRHHGWCYYAGHTSVQVAVGIWVGREVGGCGDDDPFQGCAGEVWSFPLLLSSLRQH